MLAARPVLVVPWRTPTHALRSIPRHVAPRQQCRFNHASAQAPKPSLPWARYLAISTLTAGLGLTLYSRERRKRDSSSSSSAAAGAAYASEEEARNPLATVTFSSLLRSYLVYTCCSFATLVDYGPALVDWCNETSIPGVWPCFEFIVRRTFFAQFVGGETAEECIEEGKRLFKQSLGVILNYSAEVNESKAKPGASKESKQKLSGDKVEAIIHLIKTSASSFSLDYSDNPRNRGRDSMMIAVKLSGLIKDASVLERASACLLPRESFSEPPQTTPPSTPSAIGGSSNLNIPTASLSQHDTESLQQLWAALQDIATCARDNGNVRILIDAEHSWYQPAIDALFEACARQFNTVPSVRKTSSWNVFASKCTTSSLQDEAVGFRGPLVYNTLQTYLRRTPAYLAMSLERAKQGGYALGVKLVRGAYVEQENEEWASKVVCPPPSHDGQVAWGSPVWPNKDLTDQCFDECAALLIREVAKDLKATGKKGKAGDINNASSFARVGLVIAGHNWNSNMKAIQLMVDTGLARSTSDKDSASPSQLALTPGVRGRIHFAQLYGMADHLSRAIQVSFDPESGGPGPHLVLKFVPYGDLRLVMPYLIRRANENKSLMGGGGAQRERSLLTAEMARRLRFF